MVNEPIVIDNNIITFYCLSTASGVAFALLEKLMSKEEVDIVCNNDDIKVAKVQYSDTSKEVCNGNIKQN